MELNWNLNEDPNIGRIAVDLKKKNLQRVTFFLFNDLNSREEMDTSLESGYHYLQQQLFLYTKRLNLVTFTS
jgi:hypothetical protein